LRAQYISNLIFRRRPPGKAAIPLKIPNDRREIANELTSLFPGGGYTDPSNRYGHETFRSIRGQSVAGRIEKLDARSIFWTGAYGGGEPGRGGDDPRLRRNPESRC